MTALLNGSLSEEIFLREQLPLWECSSGPELMGLMLSEVIADRDVEAIWYVLWVTSALEWAGTEHIAKLHALAIADWHHCHEDLASLLGDIRDPSSVPVLQRLAIWEPDYMMDEFRAMAVKAVWALKSIEGPEAKRALAELLLESQSGVVRDAIRANKRYMP